jgi:hypothetical protein
MLLLKLIAIIIITYMILRKILKEVLETDMCVEPY